MVQRNPILEQITLTETMSQKKLLSTLFIKKKLQKLENEEYKIEYIET